MDLLLIPGGRHRDDAASWLYECGQQSGFHLAGAADDADAHLFDDERATPTPAGIRR